MQSLDNAEKVRSRLSYTEWSLYITLRVASHGDGELVQSMWDLSRACDVNVRSLPSKLDALIAADLIDVIPASPDAVRVVIH